MASPPSVLAVSLPKSHYRHANKDTLVKENLLTHVLGQIICHKKFARVVGA